MFDVDFRILPDPPFTERFDAVFFAKSEVPVS